MREDCTVDGMCKEPVEARNEEDMGGVNESCI